MELLLASLTRGLSSFLHHPQGNLLNQYHCFDISALTVTWSCTAPPRGQLAYPISLLRYLSICRNLVLHFKLRRGHSDSTMPTVLPVQNSHSQILGTPETPLQEIPQSCTRQLCWALQTCQVCSPTSTLSHVRDLDIMLNETGTSTTPTHSTRPSAPDDQWIS